MTILTFAPDYDHAGETDSREFQQQERAFGLLHEGCHPTSYDNELPFSRRTTQVLAALESTPDKSVDAVAFFCHGGTQWIQPGLHLSKMPASCMKFAQELARVARRDHQLIVVLYACFAGAPGGFAEWLAGELEKRGVDAVVVGHLDKGHTTRNPRVRKYGPHGSVAGMFEPKTSERRAFILEMADEGSTLHLRYPFMPIESVAEELRVSQPEQFSPAPKRGRAASSEA